ncbi:Pfs, NACHT and Ankyrin domain protein [Talaromyces pinophilus]|uniref:Pfs, NACHT and Ankyrin domain protein n=1 Tax=Talaromyces pinophilus TaxID=128442 RepID=A0A0B8N3N2_TALPI|nr:Pfs, NACHT and Ankyrin domain protein [Talaromyces pinophilus]
MATAAFELVEYSTRSEIPFETGDDRGNGASATVYEAKRRKASEYIFAAKVFYLPPNRIHRELQKTKIQHEANLILKARHKHTISLVTTYIFNNKVYIIMEPLADQNLENYLYNTIAQEPVRRQRQQNQILSWFGCLISGLAYLHELLIRHRDIKPQNILIHGDRILLADFGIATDNQTMTISGSTTAGGTDLYRPPEWKQIRPGVWTRPGRSGDVFSLGAVFLDMLLVYSGQTLSAVCDADGRHLVYRDHADRWIAELNESPMPDVEWYSTLLLVCESMLKKNPKARQHVEDLRPCWSYQPFRVVPPSHCGCHANTEQEAEDAREVLMSACSRGWFYVVWIMFHRGFSVNLKDAITGETLLSRAAGSGNENVVKLLMKMGADLEETDSNGRAALSYAARNGRLLAARLILENGAQLQAKDVNGRTALLWAAEYGHETVVELLLEKDANIHDKDEYGYTAVILAAGNGHGAAVKILLEKGAKAMDMDESGRTALSYAAEGGYQDVIDLLLGNGAKAQGTDRAGHAFTEISAVPASGNSFERALSMLKIQESDGKKHGSKNDASLSSRGSNAARADQQTRSGTRFNIELKHIQYMVTRRVVITYDEIDALCRAISGGDKEIANGILRDDPNIREENTVGQTPLCWAAETGSNTMIKFLLDRGMEIESPSYDGQTPLSWAAGNGWDSTVILLLARGAYIESRSNNGQTPLSWAATCGQVSTVELLLEIGADIETRSISGQTPLSWAAMYGQKYEVELLIKKGANINTRSNNGKSPLLWALEKGQEATADLLLQKGATIEDPSIYGWASLFRALESGQIEAFQFLLDGNASTNERNTLGQTPLAWAAEQGKSFIMKMLLDKAPDLEAKSNNGQTALSWAAAYGQVSPVRLLLDHGANIETQSSSGQTPLAWAAMYGRVATAMVLLEADANIETESRDGKTPLLWALAKGQDATVDLLLLSGASRKFKTRPGRKVGYEHV